MDIHLSYKTTVQALNVDPNNLVGFFTGSVYQTIANNPGVDDSNTKQQNRTLFSIIGVAIGLCLLIVIGSVPVLSLVFIWRFRRSRQRDLRRVEARNECIPLRPVCLASSSGPDQDEDQSENGSSEDDHDTPAGDRNTILAVSQDDDQTSDSPTSPPSQSVEVPTCDSDVNSSAVTEDTSPDPTTETHTTPDTDQLLTELYPERGPLHPTVAPGPLPTHDSPSSPQSIHSSATSSTTSLSTSMQNISRDQYPAIGASNGDVSLFQPVQDSSEPLTNHSLRYDCGTVRTTTLVPNDTDTSLVTLSHDGRPVLSVDPRACDPGRPTSLPTVTGLSSASDSNEQSSLSAYSPHTVEFTEPVPVLTLSSESPSSAS